MINFLFSQKNFSAPRATFFAIAKMALVHKAAVIKTARVNTIIGTLALALLGFNITNAQVLVTNPTSPWTVPAGVTQITVMVWAGGGGGGGALKGSTKGDGGGGGGGGGFCYGNVYRYTRAKLYHCINKRWRWWWLPE